MELKSNIDTIYFKQRMRECRMELQRHILKSLLWGVGSAIMAPLFVYLFAFVTRGFKQPFTEMPSLPFIVLTFIALSAAFFNVSFRTDKHLLKQWKVYKSARKDFNIICHLIQSKSTFFLYLRDFHTGREYIEHGTSIKWDDWISYGSPRLRNVSKDISKHFPVVALNNGYDEKTSVYKALVLHSDDDNWFYNIQVLIEACQFVVFDYEMAKIKNSDNIKLEIQYTLQCKKRLIIVGTTDEFNYIKQEHDVNDGDIFCHAEVHEITQPGRHMISVALPFYFDKALCEITTNGWLSHYIIDFDYDRVNYRFFVLYKPINNDFEQFMLISNYSIKRTINIESDRPSIRSSGDAQKNYTLKFLDEHKLLKIRRVREIILEKVASIIEKHIDPCSTSFTNNSSISVTK